MDMVGFCQDDSPMRIIDVLSLLCGCDKKSVIWSKGDVTDSVVFENDGRQYQIKLPKDPVQSIGSRVADYRVRIISIR